MFAKRIINAIERLLGTVSSTMTRLTRLPNDEIRSNDSSVTIRMLVASLIRLSTSNQQGLRVEHVRLILCLIRTTTSSAWTASS